MNYFKIYNLLFTLLLFANCRSQKEGFVYNNEFSQEYFLKDLKEDKIPGIGLKKALEFLKDKKGSEIVIAVLDEDVDIHHPQLKNYIWNNNNEIDNNNLDDDNNGYIDDINGWNFIRDSNGEEIIYGSMSSIRYIQAYRGGFIKKNRTLDIYEQVLKTHKKEKEKATKKLSFLEFIERGFPIAKKKVDSIFKYKKFSLNQLDSLNQLFSKTNNKLNEHVLFMKKFTENNFFGYVEKHKEKRQKLNRFTHNLNHNDRLIIGDNINLLNDNHYGSNVINSNLNILGHGTTVAGVLPLFKKIKIMSLVIAPKYGNRADKDIALAIRYAVDNGAKIINYSAVKINSSHNEWVADALRYAEINNVFFIRSAGNKRTNLDANVVYPNANYKNRELNNVIVVGASSNSLLKNIKPSWTNYGEKSVDLFAPGEKIKTLKSLGGYHYDSGTSLSAPLVSGTIALIMSYYPNLSNKEIKQILMKTVNKFDIEIKISNDSIKTLPFFKLSKSGGILNTYKAVLLAEKISSKK